MSEQLLIFRRYNDVALSGHLVSVLQQHNIDYELLESPMVFSASLAFNEELNKEFVVKIRPEDFERVEQLLLDEEAQHIDDVDSDYYLFAFSDEELMDVVRKYDEWNSFDVTLARKLLNERGVAIDEAGIKAKRLQELQVPEETDTFWIIVGYVSALCGGILGILIGWYLATSKKTLPNGQRIYNYSESNRRHGNRVIFIGVGILVALLAMRFYALAH
jgi:hypothetical protein